MRFDIEIFTLVYAVMTLICVYLNTRSKKYVKYTVALIIIGIAV